MNAQTDLPRPAASENRSPTDTVSAVLGRIASQGDDHVWIHRADAAALYARAKTLEALPARARPPLYGVPYAVKDNIDVAGWPTTAACPDFAYFPDRSATVVERLEAAGAILVGKTNLDQFATGLVGVRSPYGVPRNPIDPTLIPGGSSSGSAVAVAAGLVAFALGTDTAGSGRVPAMCNDIVGLKPSRGMVSCRGVLPACRTLDCVSIFARDVADALVVLDIAAGFDPDDPFARPFGESDQTVPARPTVGVPDSESLTFCGDATAEAAFHAALDTAVTRGARIVPVDFAPFLEAAALLYAGPWVAERLTVLEAFMAAHPEALHSVTREIIASGRDLRAVDVFRGQYRLAELRRETAPVWRMIDALAVPTAPTIYRVDDVLADPIRLNSNLGLYTNFVNLLDLCAIAVPTARRTNGHPFGVTLIGPSGTDRRNAGLASALFAQDGIIAA